MTDSPAPPGPPAGGPPAVLRPALALVDRLGSGPRLGVLVVLLLVPGVLSTWSYASALEGQIAFSDLERSGVDALTPTVVAMADAVTAENPGDVDLTAVEAAVARHPELSAEDELAAVQDALAGADTPEGRVVAVEAFAALATEIGNQSNLILDPDLDSFYVMESLVVSIPRSLVAAARLQAPAPEGQEAVAARAVQLGTLDTTATTLTANVETTLAETDADLASRLEPTTGAAQDMRDLVVERAGALSPATVDTTAIAGGLRDAVEPNADALDELLDTRIAGMEAQRDRTLGIAGVAFVLALYMALSVVWRTRHDVRQVVAGVEAVARGDHAAHPLPTGADEFGAIGRAVDRTREALAAAEAELARRDAAQRAATRESFLKQREAADQFRQRAQTIAEETSSVVLSQLGEVVEQVSLMRRAADAIDAHVGQADTVTSAVVDQARDTDQVLATLGESLRRVGGMAQMISGVADQSKLLALNATIEAARAGEAGKGFGVVAGEVKELATATGSSTDQITTTVADLERDTAAVSSAIALMSEGIRGVDEATSSLREVADRQRRAVEALDEVVTASMERIRSMAGLNERLDRREQERVPLSSPVVIRAGGTTLEGRAFDVSEGGIGVRLDHAGRALIGGTVIAVDLEIGGRTVTADGIVAHVAPDDTGADVGVRFREVPDGVRSVLRDAVAQPL
ncbi:MAG: methyl-accepting chemotaxis protein [Kineosporiaceae bacterium]